MQENAVMGRGLQHTEYASTQVLVGREGFLQAGIDEPLGQAVIIPQQTDEYTATESNGDTYTYRIDEQNCARIVHCKPAGSTVVVPDMLGACSVTVLEEGAFKGDIGLCKVVLPETLRVIEHKAFESCLHLAEVELNEGLESIGSEAFSLCTALRRIDIPASVRSLGANIAESKSRKWNSYTTEVHISSDNPYLFLSEDGIFYQRSAEGLILVDYSTFAEETLVVPEGTVAIAPSALAMNTTLVRVELPEGLRDIGASAFRGCAALKQVTLPQSLVRIGDGAFARTGVEALSLPASCVEVSEFSLDLGAALPGARGMSYVSPLMSIEVDPCNPVLCLQGPVLCKRTRDGLVAICCPAGVDKVDLRNVSRVTANAFAGTAEIRELRLNEGLELAHGCSLLPYGHCGRIVISLAEQTSEAREVSLETPTGQVGSNLLKSALAGGVIDSASILAAYDAAVLDETEELAQAREMVARLANPVMLGQQLREVFESTLKNALESVCLHFGARAHYRGFDHLMESGLLAVSNISDIVSLLARFGDTAASGYLLERKSAYFGQVSWDYDL